MPLTITYTWNTGDQVTAAKLNTNQADIKTFVDGLETSVASTNADVAALESSLQLDGWLPFSGTSTYASATTFVNSSITRDNLEVGDKIKLTNSTGKFFYVTEIDSGTSTITVNGGSDYSLVNSPITGAYYAKGNAVGFPSSFAYSPTITGFSSTSASDIRFTIKDRVLTLFISIYGTSNATSFEFQAPINRSGISEFGNKCGRAIDNSVDIDTSSIFCSSGSSPNKVLLYKTVNSLNSWTASGTKGATAQLSYLI